ncbi:MAG: 7-cyano-7-deazaguanine synthase [Gemmataceae bacterium]|nr:7-cyano-7-deazaguanine synthase [Gemmataceae bacterium]
MHFTHADSVAVLMSGGLDSAILLGAALQTSAKVFPLYVRCGLHWEAVELKHTRRFLVALERPALQPLTILDVPVSDLDANHWSVTGCNVPGADTPDEAVFLPGRNVLLLTKSMLWCHLHGVSAVALGVLGSNPFPDATPGFFSACEALVNRAVGGSVRIWTPFVQMHKTDVMHLGRELPLQYSFSCISPVDERHCGQCNKCQERRNAFRDAGMIDLSAYSN